jgi:hypothetical protein
MLCLQLGELRYKQLYVLGEAFTFDTSVAHGHIVAAHKNPAGKMAPYADGVGQIAGLPASYHTSPARNLGARKTPPTWMNRRGLHWSRATSSTNAL